MNCEIYSSSPAIAPLDLSSITNLYHGQDQTTESQPFDLDEWLQGDNPLPSFSFDLVAGLPLPHDDVSGSLSSITTSSPITEAPALITTIDPASPSSSPSSSIPPSSPALPSQPEIHPPTASEFSPPSSSPDSTHKSSPRKSNGFMLFRTDLVTSGRAGDVKNQIELSRIASTIWRLMDESEKDEWRLKAASLSDSSRDMKSGAATKRRSQRGRRSARSTVRGAGVGKPAIPGVFCWKLSEHTVAAVEPQFMPVTVPTLSSHQMLYPPAYFFPYPVVQPNHTTWVDPGLQPAGIQSGSLYNPQPLAIDPISHPFSFEASTGFDDTANGSSFGVLPVNNLDLHFSAIPETYADPDTFSTVIGYPSDIPSHFPIASMDSGSGNDGVDWQHLLF